VRKRITHPSSNGLDLISRAAPLQPALSAVTGVQQSEISRIESGAANPTVATISKLGGALDLKLALTPQR